METETDLPPDVLGSQVWEDPDGRLADAASITPKVLEGVLIGDLVVE